MTKIVTSANIENQAVKLDDNALKQRMNWLVLRQHFNMVAERLLPKAAPLICVTGLFAGAALSGLWAFLPPFAKATGLLSFAVAGAVAFAPLLSLRWPSRSDAIKRANEFSGIPNKLVEKLYEHANIKNTGPDTDLTPAEQRDRDLKRLSLESELQRYQDEIESLKPESPRKNRQFSKHGLKLLGLPALALAAGLTTGYGQYLENVQQPFDLSVPYDIVVPRIDAWVTQPAYTENYDQAMIADAENQNLILDDEIARTLEGSILTIRVFDDETNIELSGNYEIQSERRENVHNRVYTIRLDGDSSVQFTRREWQSPVWQFVPTTDQTPLIEIETVEHQGGRIGGYSVTATDDFGVAITGAQIQPTETPDVSGNELQQYTTPEFRLRIP